MASRPTLPSRFAQAPLPFAVSTSTSVGVLSASVATIRQALEAQYPTLHLVGRNGMHKYNNQDHAMMTAMLTVQNIKQGKRVFDVWQVNQDAEYHEEGVAGARDVLSEDISRLLGSAERLVPRRA